MYSVSFNEIIEEYKLENLTPKIDISKRILDCPEINRPALQFTGFFEYFSSERIQIIGLVEKSYLKILSKEERIKIFDKVCSYRLPCIILCRNLEASEELINAAIKYDIPIFRTDAPTSEFVSDLIRFLRVKLAPRITMHGVLVDIYGEGVLITGESGVGKSETALELIKRGHRLVADDAVEIKRVSHNLLMANCPEVIRHFIELRGIGIVNIKQMFGVQSIKEEQQIDLIIKLEAWEKGREYDRLGLSEEYMNILGNDIIVQTVPVRPGRNLAIICEAAAINRRQKKMGYNAAEELNKKVLKNINS